MSDSKHSLNTHVQHVLHNHSATKAMTLDGIGVHDGHAHIALRGTAQEAAALGPIRNTLEKAIAEHPSLKQATLTFTAHRAGSGTKAPVPETPDTLMPGVKAVVAVASGKGGVGKSTTAINLACGLAGLGLQTGLLDADIHGPSLPHMLGQHQRPQVVNRKLLPLEAWGLKTMSIGYLATEKQAMIWRGPMVMGALTQFMNDVVWGTLDVLVVDMPPGTGDAQITLTQKLGPKLEKGGAVIVSTPQDIALLDARRGVTLFERTRTPVLGLVENMSYFCCPHCQERADLFGHGGVRHEAERLGIPFLGEIPLLRDIRASADAGTPILLHAPDSDAGRAYQHLANRIATQLGTQTA